MTEEVARFARKLLEKTAAGKLPWEGTYDPSSFICVVDGGLSFTIEHGENNSFTLEMKDGTSDSIVFRETLEEPDSSTSNAYDALYKIFADLHEAARRVALQLDKKIAKAEQFLDSL